MHVIVFSGDDLFVADAPLVFLVSFVLGASFNPAGEHPERNVDAFDLLDVVLGLEGGREKLPSLVVLLEGVHGLLLVDLKGNHVVRAVDTRKFARDHRRVAAIGTAGRRGRVVADQLGAAVRAVIGAHMRRVTAPAGGRARIPGSLSRRRTLARLSCRRLRSRLRRGSVRRVCLFLRFFVRLSGSLIFLSVDCFDLFGRVSAAAVVAFQLADLTVKMKRSGTGRALVCCGFLCHFRSPFPPVTKKSGKILPDFCCSQIGFSSIQFNYQFNYQISSIIQALPPQITPWEHRTHRRTCPCCPHGRT